MNNLGIEVWKKKCRAALKDERGEINHDINMNFTIMLEAILQGLIKGVVSFPNQTPTQLSFSFELQAKTY